MTRRRDRPGTTAYWRSLAEAPGGAGPEREGGLDPEPPRGMNRRDFLRVLGASAALAGSAGCFDWPREEILPYTRRPPEVTPGEPRLYATTMETGGYGVGLRVESREGRPVKVEGNPDHPASLGAAGAYEQASLLGLYDPDRLRHPQRGGTVATWSELARSLAPGARADSGRGLRLLLEPTASPLVQSLLDRVRERLPRAGVHFHAPLRSRAAADATRAFLGRELQPVPRLDRADVVLCLDDDLLNAGPFCLHHARRFAERRRILRRDGRMNRLYAVAPSPSPTSSAADHHFRRPASRVPGFGAALLRELARGPGAPGELEALLGPFARAEPEPAAVRAVAEDLSAHRGRCVVVAGEAQGPETHLLALALNALLGSLGGVLELFPAALRDGAEDGASLEALVEAMRAGEVETLAVLGGNPAYDAPADLGFADALDAVPETVALSLLPDETTQRARWKVPGLHFLESWGDARALDGTASLVQPLIAPLFGGGSVADLLLALAGETETTSHERLRARWRETLGDEGWRDALGRGVVPGSRSEPVAPTPRWSGLRRALAAASPPEPEAPALEVTFRRDARVYDGRFANNPWLQELPEPVTKLTWENAAWLAPATAEQLGVADGDWLAVGHAGRHLEIPVLRVPGQADGSVTLPLGYGRAAPLGVASGVGTDTYALRRSEALWTLLGAELRPRTGRERRALARTQEHFRIHDRGEQVVHRTALSDYRSAPSEPPALDASLYDAPRGDSPQWGMAIDLTVCTGCSACVVACQAENNIPVVGREGVLQSREMHWLRIDRYHTGPPEEPQTVSQPMLCQHCENAPCEYVCPVNATVHSDDGLNDMIYNRCVGTRFCSNNCPYKVRRFNWFDYNEDVSEPHQMQKNPDVTVRARGVMEKCTYCVQRIRRAQIDARAEGRPLRDGEVVTACQQSCPTQAIRFGDVSDPETDVSRVLEAPQHFSVLEELGTKPRTRYLARIHNPNPRIASGEPDAEGSE